MRLRTWLTGLATACAGATLLVASPAAAADEWTSVSGYSCGGNNDEPPRNGHSWVKGGDAEVWFSICWNSSLTNVRFDVQVQDGNGDDGYHAEARIRYKVPAGSGWSDWHYRTAAAAYGPRDPDSGFYVANQKTAQLQVAACLYNGSTLIDCDDRGWQ